MRPSAFKADMIDGLCVPGGVRGLVKAPLVFSASENGTICLPKGKSNAKHKDVSGGSNSPVQEVQLVLSSISDVCVTVEYAIDVCFERRKAVNNKLPRDDEERKMGVAGTLLDAA